MAQLPSIVLIVLGVIAAVLAGLLRANVFALFGFTPDHYVAVALAVLGALIGQLDPGPGFKGPQLAVLNSRPTVDAFMAATYGVPITVIFEDAA